MESDPFFGTGQGPTASPSYFTHDSPFEVVAFTVDRADLDRDTHLGLPVIPFQAVEERFRPDRYRMQLSISYRGVNRLRAQKVRVPPHGTLPHPVSAIRRLP